MNTSIEHDFTESSKCIRRLRLIIHTLKFDIDYQSEYAQQELDADNQDETDDSVITEYLSESLDLLKQLEELAAYISYKINIIDNEDNEKLVKTLQLEKLNESIVNLRVSLREAQLIAKQNERTYLNQLRDNLRYTPEPIKESFEDESTTTGTVNNDLLDDSKLNKLNTEDKILSKNKSITNSLQASHQMLQATLMQSELNISELETSSKSLSLLHEKYSVFNGVLSRTNGLVKQINASSNKERRDIYRAVGVFCICCLWVLWRRILRKPVKLMFWILFKMFSVLIWGVSKTTSSGSESVEKDVIETIISSQGESSLLEMIASTASSVITTATAIAPESTGGESTLKSIIETFVTANDDPATTIAAEIIETVTSILRDEL